MSGNYGDLPWAEHPMYELVPMTRRLNETDEETIANMPQPIPYTEYSYHVEDQREMHHNGMYQTNQFYFTPKVWNPETKKMEGGEVYQVWKFNPVKRN